MAQNAALNTKVAALKAKSLSSEDYKRLLDAETFADVVRYLQDYTDYAPYLKGLDPNKVHRGEVEQALSKLQIEDSEKLLHYLQQSDKSLIKLFLMRFDVESLVVLIRALSKKEDLKPLLGSLLYSEKMTQVPWKRLVEAEDWAQFKLDLRGTPFYRSVETFESIEDETDLFQVEKSLERLYYDSLKKAMEKLNTKKEKSLINDIRRMIDLENLIWIYRGKHYYHLPMDTLLTHTLLGGKEVGQQDLLRLAQIEDLEELDQALLKFDSYRFLFDHDPENRDLHMERRASRDLYYKYKKLEREEGISRAYAYLQLMRYQTADIISILEGKRYKLDPNEMKNYLINDMQSK